MPNIAELFKVGRVGGNSRTPFNGVVMNVHRNGSLAFFIGAGLLQDSRWMGGDAVTIDMDCARSELTIRRIPPTDKTTVRWRLSTGRRKDGLQTSARFTLKTTPLMLKALGMEDADEPYAPETVITEERGITFPMRKQWTVHNHPRQG